MLNGKLQKHQEILRNTRLGVWEIRLDPKVNRYEMYADDTMYELMGLEGEVTPEECYMHWYGRINDGYYGYVNMAVNSIIETRDIMQVEYTWNHPDKGEMLVRCLGTRIEDKDGMICIQGYHRIISDMKKPKFLPDGITSEMFEYHEDKKTIYFHTNRTLLAGTARKEMDFPECWIRNAIVHPHFAEEFRSIFSNVQEQEEREGKEILLMTPQNTYEWVKIRIRHLGKNAQDVNTIIVILDPANQKRSLELEYMRQNDFYQAMLSETMAYAEVDVESGHLMKAGGLWSCYAPENENQLETFNQIIVRNLDEVALPEDRDEYKSYLDTETMKKEYMQGNHTRKYCFQRRNNGELCWMELTTHVFQERHRENMYALLYLKNIDSEKKRELEREKAAMRDPLTNVYNRKIFEQEVNQFMMNEKDAAGAMILLDLDDFKRINDEFGHLKGDKALQKLTEVLVSTFRRRDIIGRLGGDEFLVFLKGVKSKEILGRRMEQLYAALQDSEGFPITCSAGITIVEKKGFSYERTLRMADEALYQSKQKGKNQYCYCEE